MGEAIGNGGGVSAVVSDEALRKAELYVEEEEGAANHIKGWLGAFLTIVAVVMSLFHLYTAYAIVPTQTLRPIHVAFVLFLTFLMFPIAARFRHRIMWWDWIAALLAMGSTAFRWLPQSPLLRHGPEQAPSK